MFSTFDKEAQVNGVQATLRTLLGGLLRGLSASDPEEVRLVSVGSVPIDLEICQK